MVLTKRMLPGQVLCLMGLLLVALSVVFIPHEPVYQGRRLSDWLKDIEPQYDLLQHFPGMQDQRVPEKHRVAIKAVREMGVSTLSFLTRMLESRDSWGKKKWNQLTRRISWSKFKFQSAETQHERALRGLWALGPLAEPALPVLDQQFHKEPESLAALVMGAIGPPAFPILSNALLHSPDEKVRTAALGALAYAFPTNHFDDVRQVLLESLKTEPNEALTINAAWRLAEARVNEKLVVPYLLRGMKYPENDTRATSARALVNFPESAREHLSEIKRLAEDSNPIARNGALDALRQLDTLSR